MYNSEVRASWKPLTKIDKFNVRDTGGAISINDMVKENGGAVAIENIVNFVTCNVYNDKIKDGNTEYTNYFLMDDGGNLYYSSSETLASDIEAITEILSDDERAVATFSIVVRELPSKTQRQGFMKATLKAIVYADGEVES